jgi:uncharacterized OB-fold protein
MTRLNERSVSRRPGDSVADAAAPRIGPEAQFFNFLAHGKFMIQRDRVTGRHILYPRVIHIGSGSSADLEWVEASGEAVVYATTTIRRKPAHGGDYNIALVQLQEGPRLMSRVLGVAPEQVRIDMRVRAAIEVSNWQKGTDEPVVVFYPVSDEALEELKA